MQYSRKCFQWEVEADKKFKKDVLAWKKDFGKLAAKSESDE